MKAEEFYEKYSFSHQEIITSNFLVKYGNEYDTNKFGMWIMVWHGVIGPKEHPAQINSGPIAKDGSRYLHLSIESDPFYLPITQEGINDIRKNMEQKLLSNVDKALPITGPAPKIR